MVVDDAEGVEIDGVVGGSAVGSGVAGSEASGVASCCGGTGASVVLVVVRTADSLTAAWPPPPLNPLLQPVDFLSSLSSFWPVLSSFSS